MAELTKDQIVNILSKVKSSFNLTVKGNSMFPTLKPDDIVTIKKKQEYAIGDILVFNYKDEGILVHRLLKISSNTFYCKGDNSFRLEDVELLAILGCVELSCDKLNTEEFIFASYKINRIFKKNGYNAELTKQTEEYKEYSLKYLR